MTQLKSKYTFSYQELGLNFISIIKIKKKT